MTKESCPWIGLDDRASALDLEQFPSFLLVRLVASLQRKLTRPFLDPHELSVPDWRVLNYVYRFGPARFSDLSARMSLDKAQVSRTVKHLESRGLIAASDDPAHQQRLILDVTTAGRRLYRRILPLASKAQMSLLAPLDANERRVMFNALHKIQAAIDPDSFKGRDDDDLGRKPKKRPA